MRKIKEIAIKELRSISRDPVTVIILFVLPFILVAILGKALRFDLVDERFGVLDYSETPHSHELIMLLDCSSHLSYVAKIRTPEEIVDRIISDRLRFVVVIPPNLERGDLLEVFIDGSDLMFAESLALQITSSLSDREALNISFLYNPTLRGDRAPLPGLVMVALILISAIMLSLSINRERERGTARLLLLTPASMEQIIIGKSLPYFLISILHGVSIFLLFRFMFEIDTSNLFFSFLTLTSLFALNAMMIGLFLASFVKRELELLIACWLFVFIPNVLFSSFIFPIESMHKAALYVAPYLPGTIFIRLFKSLIYRGVPLYKLFDSLMIIITEAVILYLLSITFFKRSFFRK